MDPADTPPSRPAPPLGGPPRRVGRRALFAGGAGAALATTLPGPADAAGPPSAAGVGTGAAAVVREAPLSLLDPAVGCRLDGSDEWATVTTALTTLLPAGGGEIYHPAGRLGLGAELVLPKNVTWTGANVGGSVISPANGWTGRLVSTGFLNHLRGVQFDGLGTSGVLLTVRRARTHLGNLYLTNSGSHGLEFVGTDANNSAHANKVTDINVIDCKGTGVLVAGWAYDNEFLNTWIGRCQRGLRVQDSAGFFDNLHVWGCVGNGVELRNNGSHNLFQNVYLESNGGNGLDAWQVTGTQVVGGRLWRNAGTGVTLVAAPRTRISGLDFHENTLEGLRGSDTSHCQVLGNQFYDERAARKQTRPIITTGSSNHWIVSNNVMRAADHAVGGKSLAGANNVVTGNIE
ncbi:right-handed parallel beta-helix repeat-containing protein [Micromonospora sp. PLK6-60]|uniref:right-handed parallel beta-helix repeat-containing protein n=1 Tax=Micromonospora sp. PLK6-60 TaxID=2873383 RepID=UPI001CA722CC|nr:right-handed parallel beta-helix repeat-containing protein [Micromonospora sp. PLK6-60]MBY8870408.1 right-handed parallel beta-helix repeat-containing protein [Micromonospora sp. PLK6-60]